MCFGTLTCCFLFLKRVIESLLLGAPGIGKTEGALLFSLLKESLNQRDSFAEEAARMDFAVLSSLRVIELLDRQPNAGMEQLYTFCFLFLNRVIESEKAKEKAWNWFKNFLFSLLQMNH